jgi:hypothetical protein
MMESPRRQRRCLLEERRPSSPFSPIKRRGSRDLSGKDVQQLASMSIPAMTGVGRPPRHAAGATAQARRGRRSSGERQHPVLSLWDDHVKNGMGMGTFAHVLEASFPAATPREHQLMIDVVVAEFDGGAR